ncbi:DUF485 domain-containing protein [Actinocrispum wychmicini]|uniref:Uncharacterized membrane protein (DUF485 family) n=1 Tax=Actinocrispum wychmicini TaxID=1213861 RepID=A0A4R2JAQ9_9PSEU|nr:DUF485 domain-containing protein [Actinocrispum wychmicini]TCO56533.1 uncharacterized membrane protein (DUF485 family) [Actinocrispum wychmicini]
MTHWSGRTPSASFGTITETIEKDPEDGPDFIRIQESREFTELRSRLRRFVFPVSLLFLVWYLSFVVLAAYATDFMGRRVVGSVNVGLLLGLGQFASTVLITLWYRWYARRRIDPQVIAVDVEQNHAAAGGSR